MKRIPAFFLAFALLLLLLAFAFADEITDIIRLEGEPVRFLVEYTEDTDDPWDWNADSRWDLVDADGNLMVKNFAQDVYLRSDGRYEVRKDGLYGIMVPTRGFIVEPRFDSIASDSQEGFIWVKENGLFGYMNTDCELVIEPRFELVRNFSDGLAKVKENGLWGFIGTDGEYVIEPIYEYAGAFDGDYALVGLNGKKGLIDKSGAYIVDPIYNIETWHRATDGSFSVKIYETDDDGKRMYGYLFSDGGVIEPRFEALGTFANDDVISAKIDGLWGFIDRTGAFVIEPIYEKCSDFSYGLAAVKLNGLWGYIDEDGQYVFEPQFDDVVYYSFYSMNDGAPVQRYAHYDLILKQGLYGAVRREDRYLIPPQFEQLGSFSDGYAKAIRGGLYGLVDESGNWAVEPVYVVLGDYNSACAVVSMDERAKLWDYTDKAPGAGLVSLPEGKLLLELGHDNIAIAYDDGTILAEKDGEEHVYKLTDGRLEEVTVVGSSLNLSGYLPNEGEKVAALESEAYLAWNGDMPLPRLDGATALLPIYSAFAQATYPETLRYVDPDPDEDDGQELGSDTLFTCTTTAEAYDRLIAKDTDIIFCGGPSEKQLLLAKLRGVEFELTPIGHEAFVFIVNADNPIESVTVEQLRDIYSGRITSWAELGFPELGDIVAYQRSENSGSQTEMEKLMGDVPLTDAPEYVADTMASIVSNIAYRNLDNSIGYSFRFFVSGMMGGEVKLLAIDGIAPTEENIRNGSYSLISTFYAVTRKGETNPNVRILLNWICGPQGQELVEKSGYVGLSGAN